MANRFDVDDDRRRSDLVRILEHSIEGLSLPELESIYYDMDRQRSRKTASVTTLAASEFSIERYGANFAYLVAILTP